MCRTESLQIPNLCGGLWVVPLMIRSTSRPPAPHPPGWTIYGDVIVEVVGPKDPHTGLPGVR